MTFYVLHMEKRQRTMNVSCLNLISYRKESIYMIFSKSLRFSVKVKLIQNNVKMQSAHYFEGQYAKSVKMWNLNEHTLMQLYFIS